MSPFARRALWLPIALVLLVVSGLGLRGLSTLVSGADLALVRDLAGDRAAVWTACAHGFSWLGRSAVLIPLSVVIALLAAARGRPHRGLAVVGGVLGAVLLQNIDKALIGRPRPPVHQLERVSGTSFPSGHATEATAFVVVVLLAALAGARSPWLRLAAVAGAIAVAGGVALSRVYLGVHYPTDVLAGMLLGGAWGASCALVLAGDRER